MFPRTPAELSAFIRQAVGNLLPLIRQLQGALKGLRWSDEFTADSGALAQYAQSTVTVNHEIGVAPKQVVGHLEDGSWAHQFSWRVANKTTTDVDIVFMNLGNNVPTATAVLRFRILY